MDIPASIRNARRGRVIGFRISAAACLVLSAQTTAAQEWRDPTFNSAFWTPGWQSTYFIGSTSINEEAKAVARTSDGSYIVAGRVPDPNSYLGMDIGLVKYNADGSLDTTFGGLANVHGSPDPSLAHAGRVLFDAYLNDVTDMTLDSQGRIVVIGPSPTGPKGDNDFAIVRFLPDGSNVDTSFNSGVGAVTVGIDYNAGLPLCSLEDVPVSVSTDSYGIEVAGTSDYCNNQPVPSMVRIQADGTLDASFGNYAPGKSVLLMYNPQHNVYLNASTADMALTESDGYLIAFTWWDSASSFQTAMGALIVGYGGQFDENNDALKVTIQPPDTDYREATAIAAQTASEFVIAGNVLHANGTKSATACRIAISNASLAYDPTFGPNCFVSGSLNSANDIAIHSDRSIELVGDYAEPPSFFWGATTMLSRDGASHNNNIWVAPRLNAPEVSFRTSFARVILDHGEPVIVGFRSDNSNSDSDHDFVALRLKSDLIFANDFD